MKTQLLMTVFLIAGLVSTSSFADPILRSEENIPGLNNFRFITEFTNNINNVQFQYDVAYKLGTTPVADQCVSFMNEREFLGQAGQNIFKAITEEGEHLFPKLMGGGTLIRYCKRYPTMTPNQKALVWVLVLTAVAHFESSCVITAKAKGPNGQAHGYFQLHKGSEHNYDNKMGICVRNASTNEKQSSRCALAMLEYQYQRTNGNLFSSDSYWDVLRPRGRAQRADDIQRALSKSTLCNPQMM